MSKCPQRTVKPIANLFGISGGKDSTALLLWAIHLSGYARETIFVTACDTENEYQEVYDQWAILDAYAQLYDIRPLEILTSEGFLKLAMRKKRFPSARARFCTQELKIIPTQKFVQKLQAQGYEVISHSGVRRSESIERSMMEEWGFSGMLNCRERKPILDWTIEKVWAIHKEYGIKINPLYLTGRKRVGCRLCCMSNKQDVRITAKTRPEVIDLYQKWEKRVANARAKTGGFGYSSFFRASTVPMVQRSATFTNKKGDSFRVATIDDIVRWSGTLHGGKQGGFDFIFDDEPIFEIDDAHAPCKSGYCE